MTEPNELSQDQQKKRVAVVDDSSPFRMLLKQLLEANRYHVDIFASGEDFMTAKFPPETYDLIICDVYMPGVNGMNVVESIRNRVASRSVPILLVTGDPSVEVISLARKYLVNDFIGKPIDANLFLQRVRKLLFPTKKASV